MDNVENITEISNDKREDKTPLEVAQDMSADIDKMIDKRDEKVDGARDHLVETLGITREKYLTGSGVMAALQALYEAYGNHEQMGIMALIASAKTITMQLAETCESMAGFARDCELEEFQTFCDGYYDDNFANKDVISPTDLAKEILVLNLCQQVGPAAQDIWDFKVTADEEIMKVWEKLENFCQEHSLNLAETGLTPVKR